VTRSARGSLFAKLLVAALGCGSIWVLRGPWWYVVVCLFAMGLIVVDAVATYRREKGNADAP
jgi:hypothetical protein